MKREKNCRHRELGKTTRTLSLNMDQKKANGCLSEELGYELILILLLYSDYESHI